jgi:hypothetical protein
MMSFTVIAGAVLLTTAGCASLDSPTVANKLKVLSAGHTGCAPPANTISNAVANNDGSTVWNATCNGKTYLCTALGSFLSCAPAVP